MLYKQKYKMAQFFVEEDDLKEIEVVEIKKKISLNISKRPIKMF